MKRTRERNLLRPRPQLPIIPLLFLILKSAVRSLVYVPNLTLLSQPEQNSYYHQSRDKGKNETRQAIRAVFKIKQAPYQQWLWIRDQMAGHRAGQPLSEL